MVFKLKRSLYGIKQGANRWWTVLSEFLLLIGFIQCVSDPCLFYFLMNDVEYAFMTVYVDDLLLCTITLALQSTIALR